MAANGYQKHILVGNLGADPKVFQTQSGNSVTNFDIAVNERNADGTEIVTWYGIAAWNGLGEVCAEYLKKGRQVMVEGTRLEATAWVGRDGNLHTKMELTAKEVKFLGGNGDSNGTSNGDNHDNSFGRSHANNTEHQNNRRTADSSHKRQARQTRQTRQTNQHRQHRQHGQHRQHHQQQTHEYDNTLGYIPDNPENIPF